ncbi:hypothetical protein E4634_07650 [Mangrovimicrobium sediminis]|uniref:Uncharacterized protein n=1 Tax=Mangrovimicrobium sediminis TaxID=2562682 RepID=A0A4Z0M3I2_9GAMM|nr:hypothetical protein [Haliea sp. SAOS-164]TGD74006.1 hypothetical protein E4634_07650 [Haliea sp. SAOS-164]
MSEFQMTHVALVGARIDAFLPLGFRSRSELTLRRVMPQYETSLTAMGTDQARATLAAQLPIWIHNAITDPGFPGRGELIMPLRRFEGELRDSRDNEVVSAVLNAGFRNRPLDPLNLPESMPLRQRCSMLMWIDSWQEAYKHLETRVVAILMNHRADIDNWLATSEPEIDPAVAV